MPGKWEKQTGHHRVERLRRTLSGLRTGLRQGLRPAFDARHTEWSLLSSAIDLRPQPTDELVSIAISAAERARTIDLSHWNKQLGDNDAEHINHWPGEHYRLLAGLVATTKPTSVVEVGTFRGVGALALLDQLPTGGKIITYDVEPYTSFRDPALTSKDLERGVEQRIGDLSEPAYFQTQLTTLRDADTVFVDGPKDGHFERAFVELIQAHGIGPTVLVFDDVRLMNMVGFWRWLPFPKLDMTSLGHYTGTGFALTS